MAARLWPPSEHLRHVQELQRKCTTSGKTTGADRHSVLALTQADRLRSKNAANPYFAAMDCKSAITTLRSNLPPKWKQRLRRRLLTWYAKHARDLPWRRSHDPYHVWVSEIMLQQTQVATVEAYFLRFLAVLPTLHDLAAADQQQVMRLWEGLGYYRRARQLHAAAQMIVDELGGQMPQDAAGLRKLPGIGRYTAGAICSIAYGQREPILEANTIRLLSRLVGYRNDPTKAVGQHMLWQTAEEILPRKNVAQFNQALMELGSLVCTPTDPSCNQCPVASLCAAHEAGLQNKIPLAKKKQSFTDLHEAAVIVRKNGRVLLRQCTDGERWAGLWDFPRVAIQSQNPSLAQIELADKVHKQTGIKIEPGERLKTIKHGVTRYRITLDCFTAQYKSGRVCTSKSHPVRWVKRLELAELPLSTTGRKLARLVV